MDSSSLPKDYAAKLDYINTLSTNQLIVLVTDMDHVIAERNFMNESLSTTISNLSSIVDKQTTEIEKLGERLKESMECSDRMFQEKLLAQRLKTQMEHELSEVNRMYTDLKGLHSKPPLANPRLPPKKVMTSKQRKLFG